LVVVIQQAPEVLSDQVRFMPCGDLSSEYLPLAFRNGTCAGVYLVSIDADASRTSALEVPAPIDTGAIEALLAARPELRLHGFG
jgi:hypothetical protein